LGDHASELGITCKSDDRAADRWPAAASLEKSRTLFKPPVPRP
jgi:hypothetical protein